MTSIAPGPLHVYDAAKLTGGFIEARLGRDGEAVAALDGRTYAVSPEMCVDRRRLGAIGLGGVIGGAATGCSDATTEVFIESAWFDPIRTMQTGRDTGVLSDAQYRFARGVDPDSLVPGLEAATRLILELCGGNASDVIFAGRAPRPFATDRFEPSATSRVWREWMSPERADVENPWRSWVRAGAGVERGRRHGAVTSMATPISWRRSRGS